MGRQCVFDGKHCASATSDDELTLTKIFGRRRPEYMIDKRNGLPLTSLGDKSYTIPEYSEDFHKLATCPVPGYGPKPSTKSLVTFIPLAPVSYKLQASFKEKERGRELLREAEEVRLIEDWRPATPLSLTVPFLEPIPELPQGKKNKSQNAVRRLQLPEVKRNRSSSATVSFKMRARQLLRTASSIPRISIKAKRVPVH